MNIISRIGTVRNEDNGIKGSDFSFGIKYFNDQKVTVKCPDSKLVKEIRSKLKNDDEIIVIGMIDESVLVFQEETEIKAAAVIIGDEVYPSDFPKDTAFQYRDRAIRQQKLLKSYYENSSPDDPF